MIRLITGLPGSGKTLRGVWYVQQALAEGRQVFAHGIKGLTDDFAWQDCNPREWEKLPDGALIVVDEAQEIWPQRRSGDPAPDVRALSKHRHRGFDFILMTQHPTMLDKYVRTLVGEHQHLLRQFGTGVSRVVTWQEAYDDPQSSTTRDRGTSAIWRHPKDLYNKYTSASIHTVKSRIPLRIKAIPVLVVLALITGWWGYGKLGAITSGAESVNPADALTSAPVPANAGTRTGGNNEGREPQTVEEYLASRVPRIPEQPWSAPVFDGRQAMANPEIYCVSMPEEGKCICHTEQGTRYHIETRSCMAIALNGIYNPYREPIQNRDFQRADNAQATPAVAETVALGDQGRPALPTRTIPRHVVHPARRDFLDSVKSQPRTAP